MEEKFICGSECIYMEGSTYVRQSHMKKMWPLMGTLMEDSCFCNHSLWKEPHM